MKLFCKVAGCNWTGSEAEGGRCGNGHPYVGVEACWRAGCDQHGSEEFAGLWLCASCAEAARNKLRLGAIEAARAAGAPHSKARAWSVQRWEHGWRVLDEHGAVLCELADPLHRAYRTAAILAAGPQMLDILAHFISVEASIDERAPLRCPYCTTTHRPEDQSCPLGRALVLFHSIGAK